LEKRGIVVEAAYTTDLFSNVVGGLRRGATALHNLDVTLALDGEALLGWTGGSVFVYVLATGGGSITELAGDLQGVSNIEAPAAWRVYEAWVEQRLFGNRLSVRAGLYDVNSEFYVAESAAMFVNSAQGIGPDFSQSGHAGPSIFPASALGLRLAADVAEGLTWRTVVSNGMPGDPDEPWLTRIRLSSEDGLLVTSELAHRQGETDFDQRTYQKIALGAWVYTGAFPGVRADSTSGRERLHQGNRGVYGLVERAIFHEPRAAGQGLTVFGRIGLADPNVNQLRLAWGGGAVYTGLIPGRDEDQLGLAVAAAQNGTQFIEAEKADGRPCARSEIAFEFTYAASPVPWLTVQPDLQYIVRPGASPDLANAFVAGVRLGFAF
jgi:porin